jgi:hypothetical protein
MLNFLKIRSADLELFRACRQARSCDVLANRRSVTRDAATNGVTWQVNTLSVTEYERCREYADGWTDTYTDKYRRVQQRYIHIML